MIKSLVFLFLLVDVLLTAANYTNETYSEALNRHKRQCACLSQYTPVNCKCQQADPNNSNDLACRCDRATVSPQCSCAPSASTLCFPVCQQQCIQSCVAQQQPVPQCQPPCQLICQRACQALPPVGTGSNAVYATLQPAPPQALPSPAAPQPPNHVPVVYAIPQAPAGSPPPVFVPGVPLTTAQNCVPVCTEQCMKQCPNSPGQCAQTCTYGCQQACNNHRSPSAHPIQHDSVIDCSQRCEPSCQRACTKLPSQSPQQPLILLQQCQPACVSMCQSNCQVNQAAFDSPAACAPLCRPNCAPSCVQQYVEPVSSSLVLAQPPAQYSPPTTLFETEYFIPLDGTTKEIVIPITLPLGPTDQSKSSDEKKLFSDKQEDKKVFEVSPVNSPLVSAYAPNYPQSSEPAPLPWQALFTPMATNRTTQYLKSGDTTAEIHPIAQNETKMRGVPSSGDQQPKFQVDATVTTGKDHQQVQWTPEQRQLTAAQQFTGFQLSKTFDSQQQSTFGQSYQPTSSQRQQLVPINQPDVSERNWQYQPNDYKQNQQDRQSSTGQYQPSNQQTNSQSYQNEQKQLQQPYRPEKNWQMSHQQNDHKSIQQEKNWQSIRPLQPPPNGQQSFQYQQNDQRTQQQNEQKPETTTQSTETSKTTEEQKPIYASPPPLFLQNSYSPSAHQYFAAPVYPTTSTSVQRAYGLPAYGAAQRPIFSNVDPFLQPQNSPTDELRIPTHDARQFFKNRFSKLRTADQKSRPETTTSKSRRPDGEDCPNSCQRVCSKACAKHRSYEDDHGEVCAQRCVKECARRCLM